MIYPFRGLRVDNAAASDHPERGPFEVGHDGHQILGRVQDAGLGVDVQQLAAVQDRLLAALGVGITVYI